MNIDLPHMLVTGLLVFIVVYAVEHSGLLTNAGRAKRAIVTGVFVFVALFILNAIWPYPAL